MNRYFSVRQAARYLGVSYWTVKAYLAQGKLHVCNLPDNNGNGILKRTLIDKLELSEFKFESSEPKRKPPIPEDIPAHLLKSLRKNRFWRKSIELSSIQGFWDDNLEFIRMPGYVYVIVIPSLSLTKIGRSRNPKKRFEAISQYLPAPSELVSYAYVKDATYVEGYLHSIANHRRIKGEWFWIDESECKQIIAFLQNVGEPNP